MEKDEDADVERLVHLQLAAGKASDATSGLVRAGRDEEAFTVACTAAEGRFGPEIAEDAGGTPSPSPLKKLAPLGSGGGGGSPPKPAGPLSPPPAPGHHARMPSDGSGAGGPLDTLPHNLDGSLPAALKARNSLPSLGGGVGKLAPLPPIAGAGTLNKLRAVSAFGSLQTNGNGHASRDGDGGALPRPPPARRASSPPQRNLSPRGASTRPPPFAAPRRPRAYSTATPSARRRVTSPWVTLARLSGR